MASTDVATFPKEHQHAPRRRVEQLLHRELYLALQIIRGRPVGHYMRRLARWDRLGPDSFRNVVERRLEEMLAFARSEVPLYATEPWASIRPEDAGELARWPVLERAALLEKRDLLMRRQGRRWLVARRSSASTGTPVEVFWNRQGLAASWAAEYQPMQWHGLSVGTRTLRIWGSGRPLENRILNRHFVPAHELTPTRLDRALRYLETERPPLVWGTPSAVSQLARHVGKRRKRSAPLVPFVKVGGEQLYAFQRAEIEHHLGARVIEAYGCTEVGAIAAECPHGSMHVLANVHVEICRDGEPVPAGEFGDIVATSLVNRGMPLVRCRIGDLGRLSPEPCRCGRPQPVLAELRGRAADLLLATDGRPLHGSVLGDALKRYVDKAPLSNARTFLFAQLDRLRWRVELEGPEKADAGVLKQQVSELLREVFGTGCIVDVEVVEKIAREPSGKYRYYRTPRGPASAQVAPDALQVT